MDFSTCCHCGHKLRPGEVDCGKYGNGEPSRDHKPNNYHPFVPYLDENISPDGKPVMISNPGDRKKYMRKQWRKDFLEQTDFYGSRPKNPTR